MNRRLTQLRDGMASSDLDAIIATSYASFYYLTGVPIFPYGRPMAALVPREGEPTIVASVIEQAHARTQAYATDLRFYWDYNPEPEYEKEEHRSICSRLDRIEKLLEKMEERAGGKT